MTLYATISSVTIYMQGLWSRPYWDGEARKREGGGRKRKGKASVFKYRSLGLSPHPLSWSDARNFLKCITSAELPTKMQCWHIAWSSIEEQWTNKYFYTSVDIDICIQHYTVTYKTYSYIVCGITLFCFQEEVLSQLQAQQKFMTEAQAERNRMLEKIAQLEEMVEWISLIQK